jgi:hypothetical protein
MKLGLAPTTWRMQRLILFFSYNLPEDNEIFAEISVKIQKPDFKIIPYSCGMCQLHQDQQKEGFLPPPLTRNATHFL